MITSDFLSTGHFFIYMTATALTDLLSSSCLARPLNKKMSCTESDFIKTIKKNSLDFNLKKALVT